MADEIVKINITPEELNLIKNSVAKGATEKELLEDYPELEQDDLRAALLYAHHMVARENVFDRAAVG